MKLGFWNGFGKPLSVGLGGNTSQTWQEQLLALFPAGDDVGIWYDVTATPVTTYNMYKHLTENKYWRMTLGAANLSVGQNAMTMGAQDICTLYKAFNDQTTPAVTENGTWTKLANANYPGGRLMYKNSASGYLELTATCTTFGMLGVGSQTGVGVVKVSIDGDATLADLLPTAQSLVDSGALANTVLVANGGTLNPTDRIWDMYNVTNNIAAGVHGGACYYKLFTTSLTQGSHTLRLTYTGYKNQSSSGVLVQVFELIATGTATRTSNGGNDELISSQSIDTGNVWEISYSFKPTGATNYAWLGHAGQAKITTSPAFSVDGIPITPTDELRYAGSEIVLTQTSSIRHSEIGGGATNLGTYAITYTLNKTTGLTIAHTVTWATGGLIQGYPGMMSVNHSIYDRFKTHGNNEIDLTDNNDAVKLNSTGQAAWCWDLDGNQAALMYIPNLALTVDDWANATVGNNMTWIDISTSGGAWKKAYPFRYRTSGTINMFVDTQVISSSINYRVNWLTGGANLALAGKF